MRRYNSMVKQNKVAIHVTAAIARLGGSPEVFEWFSRECPREWAWR